MRLFVGIDTPPEINDDLRRFIESLRPLARLRWSPAENLHITTKFIGEWPESQLGEIQTTLLGLENSCPIDIAIRGVGWFPDANRPRVFWAHVRSTENALNSLAQLTETALLRLGIAPNERKFSPHLTLARIGESASLEALRLALRGEQSEFGGFRAAQFFLYLSAAGTYTKLFAFPLEKL